MHKMQKKEKVYLYDLWAVTSWGLEDGLKNLTLALALCTVILASGWLPSQGICAEFQGKGVL